MYATVILNTRQSGIGNGLTYRCGVGQCVQIGSLVKVPLRRQKIEGIVIELHSEKPEGDFDVKEIIEVFDEEPLLISKHIEAARWISEYYICPLRQSLGLWLPGGVWEKLLPEKVEMVKCTQVDSQKIRLGEKQKAVLEYLQNGEWIVRSDIQKKLNIGRDVLQRLIERGLVNTQYVISSSARDPCMYLDTHFDPRSRATRYDMQGDRNAYREIDMCTIANDVIIKQGVPSLTARQQVAYKAMKMDPRPSLLFGVTGSGKTEMYAALMRDVIENGGSAILLLPEILLTENFIERFQRLIVPEAIAIIHSRLTTSQRRNEWRRCRRGAIKLVIGSRSALFSPLLDLKLIIVDEEHEWTYKNEQSPRYHSVKVAEKMGCKCIFGSATPSVESWSKAKNGEYQLVELPERYGGISLPSVQIVDLAQVEFGKYYPLSPTLINAIRIRLNRHEQSILFLNRRGFATSLLCMECRYRFVDQETQLPYTVHFRGSEPYLLSHHTGETISIPSVCPQCGSAKLRPVGAGTQKIESLIEDLFPQARILRADADTLKTPEKMRSLLTQMKSGQADILFGTQSVVKGLDLPHVTLAAVILADVGLSLPHFRAGERVFQLLTQLTGRSGRRNPGEVIIQTFRPQAIEVKLAARHDVRGYLERELEERTKVHYPPETEMIRIVFSGEDARKESEKLVRCIPCHGDPSRTMARGNDTVFISRSPSLFGGGRVWYVFLRGNNVRDVLKRLPDFHGIIDVDPIQCV